MRSQNRLGSIPERTHQETSAQRELDRIVGALREFQDVLEELHDDLGEPPEEDQMAEGLRPETVRFSIRAAIECVVADRLEPAIQTLDVAARDTPEKLMREWNRSQRRQRRKPTPPGAVPAGGPPEGLQRRVQDLPPGHLDRREVAAGPPAPGTGRACLEIGTVPSSRGSFRAAR
ncbi:MAG TPA: hypothetical protein VHN15_14725 [Thermoanaerobaculia bacterium]|nr:hypothetical protein [Thermoanaerobaculia bacterium]